MRFRSEGDLWLFILLLHTKRQCPLLPASSTLYFHYIIGITKIINNSAGMVLNNDINLNIVEVIGCMLGAV